MESQSLEQYLKKIGWGSVYPKLKENYVDSVDGLRGCTVEEISSCGIPNFVATRIYEAVHGNTLPSNTNNALVVHQQLQVVAFEMEKVKIQNENAIANLKLELQHQIEKKQFENEKQQLQNKVDAEMQHRAHEAKLADIKTELAKAQVRSEADKEHAKELAKINEQRIKDLEQNKVNPAQWPWWHPTWGPWSWGNTVPVYCCHGNVWSHCYTGPPKYCRHGNGWGTHCHQP